MTDRLRRDLIKANMEWILENGNRVEGLIELLEKEKRVMSRYGPKDE